MRYISLVALAALTVCASSASAEIYRWQDEDGHVVYSDTPQPGAEKVEIGEPMIVPAERGRPRTSSATSQRKDEARKYESLEIARPANEETLRDAALASVNVSVSVVPGLQSNLGHKLQLLYDGSNFAAPGEQSSFTLSNVDRGAHTLQAVILDANGNIVISSPVTTFFAHKTSVLRRPAP